MKLPAIVAIVAIVLAGCNAAPPQPVPDAPPSGPVTLALAGDAMLGRGLDSWFSDDPDYAPWRGLAEPLEGVDILAFNLETTITAHDDAWDKNFTFRLAPDNSEAALGAVLRDNAVPAAMASVANNHTLDFHVPGLLDTIDALDAFGMPRAGAGRDDAEARAPTILETPDGVRVAFFAASTVCSCGALDDWQAGPDQPGAWMIRAGDDYGWRQAADAVRAVAPDVDYVVFSLHWGENWIEAWPIDWMQQRGNELVAAGVDVIFGHSSHHVLPLERVGDGLVLYGTGDFIDDYSLQDGFRNDLSYVGRVELAPGGQPEVTVIPIRLVHEDGHFAVPLAAGDPDFDLVMRATESLAG